MEAAMLTRRIDAAYFAIEACRDRTPALLEFFHAETPERVALDRLMAALREVDNALFSPRAEPPGAL
jgi:hypothetical protein